MSIETNFEVSIIIHRELLVLVNLFVFLLN